MSCCWSESTEIEIEVCNLTKPTGSEPYDDSRRVTTNSVYSTIDLIVRSSKHVHSLRTADQNSTLSKVSTGMPECPVVVMKSSLAKEIWNTDSRVGALRYILTLSTRIIRVQRGYFLRGRRDCSPLRGRRQRIRHFHSYDLLPRFHQFLLPACLLLLLLPRVKVASKMNFWAGINLGPFGLGQGSWMNQPSFDPRSDLEPRQSLIQDFCGPKSGIYLCNMRCRVLRFICIDQHELGSKDTAAPDFPTAESVPSGTRWCYTRICYTREAPIRSLDLKSTRSVASTNRWGWPILHYTEENVFPYAMTVLTVGA